MPLKKGAKPGTKGFKDNIREEVKSGKSVKQSVAIAYSESGEKKKKEIIMKEQKKKDDKKDMKKKKSKDCPK